MKVKKKGTTIVEATMVFPLVIAGVISVLYIIIGMYSSLSLQSSVHMSLRNEAGLLSETVYRTETVKEFEIERKMLGIRSIITIEESREYKASKLFAKKIARTERGRSYIIDEAELVRRVSLAKEVL